MIDFKIFATNHTSFTVSNLDKIIALFSEALGFDLLDRRSLDPAFTESVVGVPGAVIERAFLQGPGHRLELIQYHAPDDRKRLDARPCDTGFAHIAFDVDDIDAVLAAVANYGLKPLNPPQDLAVGQNKGGKVVYTRDADGITVEFMQRP